MKQILHLSKKYFLLSLMLALPCGMISLAQQVSTPGPDKGPKRLTLSNENLSLSVAISENILLADTLIGNNTWLESFASGSFCLVTDGGFGLDFVWTDWQAPGKSMNADNPVLLGKNDFRLTGHSIKNYENGVKELILSFKGQDIPILLQMIYRLDPGTFYVKRKLVVSDTTEGVHFLDRIDARSGLVNGYDYDALNEATKSGSGNPWNINPGEPGLLKAVILKKGEFGQPVALKFPSTGCFFGLEYPAATNTLAETSSGSFMLTCGQEAGMKAGRKPIESDWVVEALVPTVNVKDWFSRYVNDVRVAPARPYALYNSWYDLRSPEYPGVKPGNIMNEENVLNIIRLFKENMMEKHHLGLDAFVLDDGWDTYESDWKLRTETFPHGLKPIADTLRTLGTRLGIWLGPTGGYSFRMRRINWMKGHGYETVGNNRDNTMLCLGGKNYSALFRKRVTDFVASQGVGYFKWDGIQFSCSEPDHGHPVGIYSRRVILDSLIDKCNAVRALDPGVYLNITSGTWLSPWWVKYANQIWMQGEDYGYADVPSISRRDAAMTYKDLVLYDDLIRHDWWFPVSNLMTHGIIKGNLENLGGEDDPLDKFTGDMVFYLARGVSMYELYISPDLLTGKEWNAAAAAITWAKDRWDILSNTSMTGGDPGLRQPYGYVHLKGNHGIIAVRNPFITPASITVRLSPEYGLNPGANSLVLDKVYPCRYISRRLYSAGATVEILLEGYETAVFEIYPVTDAKEPLVCGARFEVTGITGDQYHIRVYDAPLGISILNPESVSESSVMGMKEKLSATGQAMTGTILGNIKNGMRRSDKGTILTTDFSADTSVKEIRYAVLLKPSTESRDAAFPDFAFHADTRPVKSFREQEKTVWAWYSVVVPAPVKEITADITNEKKDVHWKGTAAIYAICRSREQGTPFVLTTIRPVTQRPMLPAPLDDGMTEKIVKIGEMEIEVGPVK